MRPLAVGLVLLAALPVCADERLDAVIAQMKQTPKIARALWSAYICSCKVDRDAAIIEIDNERKYARYGGVVDKGKLYELQRQIREADEGVAAAKARMKREKIALQPCKADVLRISECLRETPAVWAKCDDLEMQAATRAARELAADAEDVTH